MPTRKSDGIEFNDVKLVKLPTCQLVIHKDEHNQYSNFTFETPLLILIQQTTLLFDPIYIWLII